MLEEDDYSSDTSDEDFIPEGEKVDDDPESEDDEVNESEEDEESHQGKKRKPNRKVKENKRKKGKTKSPFTGDFQSQESEPTPKVDEVQETKKADSLWADFLADVDEKPAEQVKPKPKNSWATLLDPNKKKAPTAGSSSTACTTQTAPKDNPQPSMVKITKVFEFAGEEVRVDEEVAADSIEAKMSAQEQNGSESGRSSDSGVRKPAGLSGVLSLLDNKKKKLSTLEKTKLDWVNFKSSEGIQEELHTHLKSKEGYLEKQDFLERTDLRQFEIERNMRQKRRSNR